MQPACAKRTQTRKPTGFFLREGILMVCKCTDPARAPTRQCLQSRRKEKGPKEMDPTDRGRKRAGTRSILKPLTQWFPLIPYCCEIQANRSSQEPPGMQSLGTWFGLLLIKKKKGNTYPLSSTNQLCHKSHPKDNPTNSVASLLLPPTQAARNSHRQRMKAQTENVETESCIKP